MTIAILVIWKVMTMLLTETPLLTMKTVIAVNYKIKNCSNWWLMLKCINGRGLSNLQSIEFLADNFPAAESSNMLDGIEE